MIFGQGAIRCHPYVLKEMEAAANPDVEEGAEDFDELLASHMLHTTVNTFGAFFSAFTRSYFNSSPMSGPTKQYYKEITRLSKALAVSSDFAMLTMGGDLKRKEMISARLGDGLSYLYMASAVLKKYEDEGRQQQDLEFVHYAIQHCFHNAANSLQEAYSNFPNKTVGYLLKGIVFPLGNHFKKPSDELSLQIADSLMTPGAHRDRLTHLCYVGKDESDSVGLVEAAFQAMYGIRSLERKLFKGIKSGQIDKKAPLETRLSQALEANILTSDEIDKILVAEKLRSQAIQVDHFSHDFSEVKTQRVTKPKLNSVA